LSPILTYTVKGNWALRRNHYFSKPVVITLYLVRT
jgi:hypothetical protein